MAGRNSALASDISLFSIHRRRIQEQRSLHNSTHDLSIDTTWNLLRQKPRVHSPASSTLSVVSSETRRLLRDLERRNSPVTAAKRIKFEGQSSFSSPHGTLDSEVSSPSSTCSSKPPLSSLVTPYRAHVLPRLATLIKAPYSRPHKETAEKSVTADLESLFPSTAAGHSTPSINSTSNQVNLMKSTSKLKVVGGGRNRFTAHGVEDEPEVLYDNKNRLPELTIKFTPAAGFLFSETGRNTAAECSSPSYDTFHFSSPIVVAYPGDINSPSKIHHNCKAEMPNKHVQFGFTPTFDKTKPLFSEGVAKTAPYIVVAPSSSQKTWACTTCFVKNQEHIAKCVCCHAERPGAASEPSKTPTSNSWTCPECLIKNSSNGLCIACGSDKNGNVVKAACKGDQFKTNTIEPDTKSKPTWSCTTCFISNPFAKVTCMACQSAKPGVDFKPVSFGFKSVAPTKSSTVGVQCLPTTTTPSAVSNGPTYFALSQLPISSATTAVTTCTLANGLSFGLSNPVPTNASFPTCSTVPSTTATSGGVPFPIYTTVETLSGFTCPPATTTAPKSGVFPLDFNRQSAAPVFSSTATTASGFSFGSSNISFPVTTVAQSGDAMKSPQPALGSFGGVLPKEPSFVPPTIPIIGTSAAAQPTFDTSKPIEPATSAKSNGFAFSLSTQPTSNFSFSTVTATAAPVGLSFDFNRNSNAFTLPPPIATSSLAFGLSKPTISYSFPVTTVAPSNESLTSTQSVLGGFLPKDVFAQAPIPTGVAHATNMFSITKPTGPATTGRKMLKAKRKAH